MPLYAIQSVLVGLLADLTPYERFEAMRQLEVGRHSLLTNRWFVLLGWSMVFFLILLLLAVRRMRIDKEKRLMEEHYDAMCDHFHLTAGEREILDAIAARITARRKEVIFSDPDAFENGLARLMQDVFAEGQNLVYRRKLQTAVYAVKEKLGYHKPRVFGQPRSGKVQSSRHIPTGKNVSLSLAGQEEVRQLSATVTANDEYEFVVATAFPLASQPGQVWTVRYDTGSVTWEFEAITLAATERGLELNHSERIRFVNRRRFPRVAVRKDAVIAPWPQFRTLDSSEGLRPTFYEAQVNELSGPGLRLHTDLELAVHDRVLVSIEVEPGRAVQDIGLVRDFRPTSTDQAVIIELVGLNDRAADELVRITNQLAGQTPLEAVERKNNRVIAEVS